jgi:hypothetical protein
MEATKNEVALKDAVIQVMQKAGKTEYRRGKVRVKLIPEKIKVKVKILTDEELEKEQTAKASKAGGKDAKAEPSAASEAIQ